ncbi:hypothetical protein [Kitasatospora sp. HPMI-4]|uniref:hypothetical protein n=1 Tax=Kitasatospora sp. HPMI-4 TaxID=3448443 RepID=UPI003F1E2AD8
MTLLPTDAELARFAIDSYFEGLARIARSAPDTADYALPRIARRHQGVVVGTERLSPDEVMDVLAVCLEPEVRLRESLNRGGIGTPDELADCRERTDAAARGLRALGYEVGDPDTMRALLAEVAPQAGLENG